MSLYNMLFGENDKSEIFLRMLGLTKSDTGRFRDCYLEKDSEGKLRIVIHTRNGGGNRSDYCEVTDALSNLPTYIYDYDNDFDCTYANYEFYVPQEYSELAEKLMSGSENESSPDEKWRDLIAKLKG